MLCSWLYPFSKIYYYHGLSVSGLRQYYISFMCYTFFNIWHSWLLILVNVALNLLRLFKSLLIDVLHILLTTLSITWLYRSLLWSSISLIEGIYWILCIFEVRRLILQWLFSESLDQVNVLPQAEEDTRAYYNKVVQLLDRLHERCKLKQDIQPVQSTK